MQRFLRQYRLADKTLIRSIFTKSNKIAYKNLLVRYKKNNEAYARLAIIISKHMIKKAVLRNQYRRIIRESFRHHQEMIKGLDLLVIMQSKCSTLDKQLFRKDVDGFWQKIARSKALLQLN
jgi:ribonuclease P protein component